MKKCLVLFLVSFLLILTVGCSTMSSATTNQPIAQEKTAPPTAELSYYFSRADQHPDQTLIGIINSTDSTLDIAIYSMTKPDMVNAIAAAKKRGAAVRIITDRQEAGSKAQKKELAILKKDGISIKVNSHKGLMHLKVTIADDSTATTGSYNYTDEATYDNDEVLVVIRDPGVARGWESEFRQMWGDTADYENWSS
jgi:phosphatidylserine/phosphatidylglycerophosphate/cardiolipin synthase-like enzyme